MAMAVEGECASRLAAGKLAEFGQGGVAEDLGDEGDPAAAALAKIGAQRMGRNPDAGPAAKQGLGLGNRPPFEAAAADGSMEAPRRHHHVGSGLARHRAFGGRHRDKGRFLAGFDPA